MPGGVINTGSHPKALWPGVHAWWGQVYSAHEAEYPDLYDQLDSSQAYEEDAQITGFGLAPAKPEGSSGTYDSELQGFISRYTHIAYSLGYKVTFEELRDNLYEQVSMRRAQANAFSMQQTIENVAVLPYNDAFTGSFYLHADGQPLCSALHPNVSGGTYSNALTPAADLCEASAEDMCIQIMGASSDRGLLISVIPQSLHVPRQEWFNANRILKSVMQSDVMSNNINVLKSTNAFPKGIKMNHYFTSAHAWFVRTNCPNGMQMFWRDRPMFDQDNDFDTKNAKALAYMRFSLGDTDPRGIYGSNGP